MLTKLLHSLKLAFCYRKHPVARQLRSNSQITRGIVTRMIGMNYQTREDIDARIDALKDYDFTK